MNDQAQGPVTRTQIAVRLLFSLLYVIIFEIVKAIILLTTLVQFVLLLITLKHNEPARTFANKVATYAYRVMRYLTLNENRRPFPFSEFPEEMELPDEEVSFE
jgi:D-alanyl-lipoteichoic acid acyltransferase DltB (MBOAT superfamily)